ncbi:MAG: type VI secretion system ImpA family N-terminal domain-containing protein, partial [Myxococcales bacterium]|nr:type VI secretion system ImpA family N-terminal domain-containing protein [Myxococcales bacterium]
MLGIDNSALESRARALIGDRSLPAVNCSASPGFRRIRTELDRLGAARGGVVDWELVAREGARLLREEAHDVRVACFVARALSEREGLIGLAVGVTTLRLLITERAETLWPPAARARGRAQALESLLDGVTARIVDDPGEDPEGAAALAWAVVELARAARAVDSIWEELLAPFTRVVNRLVERAGITGGEHVHASADQGRSARARESGGSSSARESGGTRSTSDAFGHGQATSLPVDAARSQEAPANPDTLSRSAGVCSSEARSRGAAAGSAAATVDDDPRAPLQLVDDHPEPRAEHGDGGGASRGCDQDMSDPRVQERRAIDDGMKQTVAQPDEAAHGDGSQPIAGTLETPQRPRDGAADGAELVVPASADRRGASNRGGDHRTTSERALRAASQQEDRGAEDGGDAAYDEASTRATGSETNARDPRVPGVAGHESAGDDREAQRSVLRGAHDRGVRSILEIAQQLRRVDPRDPRGYRYARIALWSLTWQAVPSSGRVAVPSLPDGIRAHLAGLMTARRFPELVADAEATVVRYRYSLDLQRWIVLGLAGSG